MPHKGYHCAYDTHYHIVFPVKYRSTALRQRCHRNQGNLKKTCREIRTGYRTDRMWPRPHTSTNIIPSEILNRTSSQVVQKHHRQASLFEISWTEKGPVGWRVLDRWLLCRNCRRARKLVSCGKIRQKPRRESRWFEFEIVVTLSHLGHETGNTLCSLAQGDLLLSISNSHE